MDKSFQDIESAFQEARDRFRKGELDQRQFVDRMKRLRLKDGEGRLWMIGARSGLWYRHDGTDWVQATPPSLQDGKAICIFCGCENDLTAEVCRRCGGRVAEEQEEGGAEAAARGDLGGRTATICKTCGAKLRFMDQRCPYCSTGPAPESERPWDESAPPAMPLSKLAAAARRARREEYVLRSVKPLSFLFFGGAAGALWGAGLGLLAGATSLFPGFVAGLPDGLIELQGKLVGGLIYTAGGAVLGFILTSAAGFLGAVLLNVGLSFCGGLRFELEPKPREVEPE